MAVISITQTTIKSMKKKRTACLSRLLLKANRTIFLGLMILFSCSLWAQDLNKKLSIEFNNTALRDACNIIEKQTGFKFSYSETTLLAYGKNITLSLSDAALNSVLDRLFGKSPVTYAIKGNLVILSPDPAYKNTPARVKKDLGKLTGKVIDEESGEPVIGATIRVADKGVTTDENGAFSISLAKGRYEAEVSFVEYGTKKITDIIIKDDEIFTLKIPLKKEKGQLGAVTITARRIRETGATANVINEIRESDAVVSGIGKEQISRSQDRDAAEVVRRIPGVSVMQNRFIIVRGLPQRYNSVMLNGTVAPSFEADSRAFSFDIMPSSMLDRIMVYKTAMPELPGDFAGAVVKVYTTGMPAKNTFNVSYLSSFRQNTTLKSFYEQPQGSKAWLGYDDGTYTLPKDFKAARDLTGRIDLMSTEERRPLNKLFNENWDAGQHLASLDKRFNIDFAQRYNLGHHTRLGFVSAFSYSDTYAGMNISRNTGKFAGGENKFSREYSYLDKSYEHGVRVNGLLNLALHIGDAHQIEFKNLYTHLGSSTYVDRIGLGGSEYAADHEAGKYIGQKVFTNTYRGTYLGQLSGNHSFFENKTKVDWVAAYNLTKYSDPDQRSRIFYANPATYYNKNSLIEQTLNNDIISDVNRGRQYITLPDTSKAFGINLTQNFNIGNFHPNLKAGLFIEDRSRSFEFIQLGYLNDDRRYSPGYVISEVFGRQNSYTAANQLRAYYFSTEIPVGNFKLNGGLRVEKNKQELHTYAYQTTGPLANMKYDLYRDHTSLLPSLNLQYSLTERSLIRTAYYKTLNRPEFREIASFFYKDFYTGRLAYGNPDLQTQTDIDNVDLRFEHYPGEGEIFTFGVFYKRFKNPIEYYYYVGTSSRNNFQWGNAPSAESYGAELEFILGLNRFFSGRNWGSRQLQKISVLFNAAYIKSKVNLGNAAGIQDKDRPLYGQSPYLINSSIYYTDKEKGLSVSLSYNVIGKRLFGIGNIDYPNIYEMPRNLLDLTFSKRVGKIWEIKGGVQNILNARSIQIQDVNQDGKYKISQGEFSNIDNLYESSYQGAYFSLGFGIKL
jgi:outer membrane receptor protein involved in Fe transport